MIVRLSYLLQFYEGMFKLFDRVWRLDVADAVSKLAQSLAQLVAILNAYFERHRCKHTL